MVVVEVLVMLVTVVRPLEERRCGREGTHAIKVHIDSLWQKHDVASCF